jgi:hypothetical protein
MNLEFNKDSKTQRTQEAFKNALTDIGNNLLNGNKSTDLYIDKEIASDVRSMLDTEFERQGKSNNFDWAIVRTGSNFRTGRTEYFTGETIGDQKHYKLKYSE